MEKQNRSNNSINKPFCSLSSYPGGPTKSDPTGFTGQMAAGWSNRDIYTWQSPASFTSWHIAQLPCADICTHAHNHRSICFHLPVRTENPNCISVKPVGDTWIIFKNLRQLQQKLVCRKHYARQLPDRACQGKSTRSTTMKIFGAPNPPY